MTVASVKHTVQDLVDFESRVEMEFGSARINGPIHLCDPSQALPLLRIFELIRDEDWVFASWRSHFHALLKGIPEDELFKMICEGRSMMIHSSKYRFFTSSIVAGIAPIALGVAKAIKLDQGTENVYLFVGDMTACTGLFKEVQAYACHQQLPLQVIVEDNDLSTNTPTRQIFGLDKDTPLKMLMYPETTVRSYVYNRDVPHVGISRRVDFR